MWNVCLVLRCTALSLPELLCTPVLNPILKCIIVDAIMWNEYDTLIEITLYVMLQNYFAYDQLICWVENRISLSKLAYENLLIWLSLIFSHIMGDLPMISSWYENILRIPGPCKRNSCHKNNNAELWYCLNKLLNQQSHGWWVRTPELFMVSQIYIKSKTRLVYILFVKSMPLFTCRWV